MQHLANRLVAAGPREDEEDRGQEVLAVQERDDFGAVDAPIALPLLVIPATVAAAAAAFGARR